MRALPISRPTAATFPWCETSSARSSLSLGALSLVAMRGISDDVYVQIGLVMLIGLSAKNSILIVEFAEQQLEHGKTIIEAGTLATAAAYSGG